MEAAIQGLLGLLFWILFAAIIFVLPTWLLWNWLMPDLFGLPQITFFQSLGLILLCGMLFRSSVKVTLN
jgi:hypothetical protein